MQTRTNEESLEDRITRYLVENQNYTQGTPLDFNKNYALDTNMFWQFLENSQSDELEKIKKFHTNYKLKVEERFNALIKKKGIIFLLKKGLDIDNTHLILSYPQPLASSSQKSWDLFAKNSFSVTRQVRYSNANPGEEIDLVIFLNGMPIITIELKNKWTHQTAKVHGIKQYKKDRDATQPLLQFARCIVHMTIDTDEAYMCTKLAGEKSTFLPFNKGNNGRMGNPINKNGHATSYVWEEIFRPESLINIIQRFVRIDGESNKPLSSRNLFFPRYHQLDVVRKLVDDVAKNGVGRRYLIQHSAGSGKSNSITWCAFQLIETYPTSHKITGDKSADKPLFDTVIVVTDRRLLDKQLKENIKDFSEVKNIVQHASDSKTLKSGLESGKKIIITTIQKFPFIAESIQNLGSKNFAVIIDEAHSSQSGGISDKMNKTLNQNENDKEVEEYYPDASEIVLKSAKGRKMATNASYFAFTATPKNITLEKFGIKQESGEFKPFHLYSMKQAIEEGFILDVLSNYTTYKSYYEIQKSIENNPLFNEKKAQQVLKSKVEKEPKTIEAKATIMVDHFLDKIFYPKKLKNQARGMVITQSISSAIEYYKAINKILDKKGNPFKVLISFSGSKEIDGIEYSETQLNGFPEERTKEYFNGVDGSGKTLICNGESIENTYRLLIVANKYLTGFDQPKLTAMYVDKKLQGVLCVQALSRLNRSASKLNKTSQTLFVLDFFNDLNDIKTGFDAYYTTTTLSEATNIDVLNDLKIDLNDLAVYEWDEVKSFSEKILQGVEFDTIVHLLLTAANRFNNELELEHSAKVDFKVKAKQFVKIYGQMASLLPFENVDWELLYWFLKYLIFELDVKTDDLDFIDGLLESVDLATYGLVKEKINEGVTLDDEETKLDPQNSNVRGAHGLSDEKTELDIILEKFNEHWFKGWSLAPEEQKDVVLKLIKAVAQDSDFIQDYKNNSDNDNREIAKAEIFENILFERRKKDLELYKLLNNSPESKKVFRDYIFRLAEGDQFLNEIRT